MPWGDGFRPDSNRTFQRFQPQKRDAGNGGDFFARQSDDRFIQRIGTDEPRPIRRRIGTRPVPRRRVQHRRPFGGQGKSGNRRGDCIQRLHPCHGVRRTAQHLFGGA